MSFPTVTPTLNTGGTYSANDYVGTNASPMEFTDCGRAVSASGGGGGGYVVGASIIDGALKSVACELWVFDTTMTPPDDNAAWTLSDADAKKLVCVIPFSTYYASALNSVAWGAVDGGAARYQCAADSKSLFGCLVTRGAPVYASGDVTIRLSVLPD